jgi:CheY-like chemotaxis protein
LALLAGRKLLLADDSITIQKIVALTFADEGIQVVATSDGAEAIEKLEEISPDIVLADVFMPRKTGYEVCEHIKRTEKLKDIPVMLLVGSFEPFDEVEARRVGADDILTKPFQSIRTLVDKVNALLGREKPVTHPESISPAEPERAGPSISAAATDESHVSSTVAEASEASAREADTQDLPPPEVVLPPDEPLTTEELEITTADTQPLSDEIRQRAEESRPVQAAVENVLKAKTMHTNFDNETSAEPVEAFDDGLLDLGHFESAGFAASDDVVLDLDFDAMETETFAYPAAEAPVAAVAVETVGSGAGFVHAPAVDTFESRSSVDTMESETGSVGGDVAVAEEEPAGQAGHAEHFEPASSELHAAEPHAAPFAPEPQPVSDVSAPTPAGLITLDQISPEVIDAIARRAVAQLSAGVIEQIGWEVVPQLAELMIKRMLEERESQNK